MKFIKSIICILLVVLMSIFTLSCENIGVDKSILNQKNKISNKVDYKNFEMMNYYKEKKVINSTSGYINSKLYIKNNEIYLVGIPYDLGINATIQENSDKNGCIVYDKNGDQKTSFILPINNSWNSQLISDDETTLVLSETKNQSSYTTYNIIEVDNNGQEIKRYDLNDFFYKKNFMIKNLKKTKENDLVISYVDQGNMKIVVMDENQNIKFKSEDLEEKDYKYFILNENSTEAIYLENGIYKIATLDIENKKIHNENELYGFDELFLFNLKLGVGKYSFIFMHNNSIFGYDKEIKKIVEIINLTNANVDGYISDYAMLNEEEVVITKYNNISNADEFVITYSNGISYEENGEITKYNDISNEKVAMPIYTSQNKLGKEEITNTVIYSSISKEEFSKINNKKIITLGGVYLGEEAISIIKSFNDSNEEYKILVKDYSSYSGYNNYTQAASDLNEDLMSENAPDIIISNSNYNIEHLINKGVLADLNQYIENDKELLKDDYLEKAFELGKRGNELYYFYPSFRVKTLVGEKEEVGEKRGWDINEFTKFLSEKGEKSPFITYSKRALFELLLNLYMEDYIDYEKNTCNFEKESFVKILEFIKENSEKMISGEVYLDLYTTERDKNAYLNEANIYSFANLRQILEESDYGEKIDKSKEITLKGMPSKLGNGSVFLPEYIVAISEHSENKDAAWKFVKKFLSDEFQNYNPIIFSIKKSAFTDENYSEYNDFISSLSQVYVSDVEILDIIEEEYYYLETGESTATQVARQVQKRVVKYLEQLTK